MLAVEELRVRARAWLAENAPRFEGSDPADLGASRAFRMELWDAALLGLTLDPAYGGQGLTPSTRRLSRRKRPGTSYLLSARPSPPESAPLPFWTSGPKSRRNGTWPG